MKQLFTASFVVLTVAAAPAAMAGNLIVREPPVATATGDDETALFAGLNWSFGQGRGGLDGVLGAIYAEVDAQGDRSGALLTLNFDLSGRGDPADLRLAGFSGNDTVAGQLGFGINLDGSGAFGLAGFLTDFAQGGMTYGLDGDIGGFFGLHSYEFLEPRMPLPQQDN